MSGFEFATEINRYLERHGLHLHKLAKIVSNPDKSKHLETATMRIEDLDVDFVNLRSETYLENSRIPVVVKYQRASFLSPKPRSYYHAYSPTHIQIALHLSGIRNSIRRCHAERYYNQCIVLQPSHTTSGGFD